MDHSLKVFDHIKYNKLPLKYKLTEEALYIDCSGWDINEIDNMILLIGGTREGFIVTVPVEGYEANDT